MASLYHRHRGLFFRIVLLITMTGKPCATAGEDADLTAGQPIRAASERYAVATSRTSPPDFQKHVVPLFGSLGCSARECHGSFKGRGGFRLSLFGSDLDADFKALLEGKNPRVDRGHPNESLILEKATAAVDHGGGRRIEVDSWEHRLLEAWIKSAPVKSREPLILMGLEVIPTEIRAAAVGETVSLKAIATWSDGTVEDVTPLCRYASNDDQVARVGRDGTVTVRGRGEANVAVSYAEGIAAIAVSLAWSDVEKLNYPDTAGLGEIDIRIIEKLKVLGIAPSDVCSDADFLRRASLDITGSLPTVSEVESFLADKANDKRAKLIDALLERPGYAAKWSTWLCDITGNNPRALSFLDIGTSIASRHWYDWIYKRVAENVPYYAIAAGIVMGTSRDQGESFDDYCTHLSSAVPESHREEFAGRQTLPYFWMRGDLKTPRARAMAIAYSFLGIRLQCAECHKHPFDVWTKADLADFAKFFERIKYDVNPNAKPEYEAKLDELGLRASNGGLSYRKFHEYADSGKVVPFRELYVPTLPVPESKPAKRIRGSSAEPPPTPRLLGGLPENIAGVPDPRAIVVEWLGSEDCPRFAQAFVNRVWAQYFGVGIVDPPDDLSLGNPPSNWQLLEYLAAGFVEHQYDMKWLHREIANSRAYQTSAAPNDSNRHDRRNFSHHLPQHISAEILYDALRQVTSTDAEVERMQIDVKQRAIGDFGTRQPRSSDMGYALSVFGKPFREKECDCERTNSASLLETIYLRNDPVVSKLIDREDGWIAGIRSAEQQSGKQESAGSQKPASLAPDKLIEACYVRTVSRLPTSQELSTARRFVAESRTVAEGVRDVLWSLINTKEFVINR